MIIFHLSLSSQPEFVRWPMHAMLTLPSIKPLLRSAAALATNSGDYYAQLDQQTSILLFGHNYFARHRCQ